MHLRSGNTTRPRTQRDARTASSTQQTEKPSAKANIDHVRQRRKIMQIGKMNSAGKEPPTGADAMLASKAISPITAGVGQKVPAQTPSSKKNGNSDLSSVGSKSDTSSQFEASGQQKRKRFPFRISADSASDSETTFASQSEVSAITQENRELKLRLRRMEELLARQAARERETQRNIARAKQNAMQSIIPASTITQLENPTLTQLSKTEPARSARSAASAFAHVANDSCRGEDRSGRSEQSLGTPASQPQAPTRKAPKSKRKQPRTLMPTSVQLVSPMTANECDASGARARQVQERKPGEVTPVKLCEQA